MQTYFPLSTVTFETEFLRKTLVNTPTPRSHSCPAECPSVGLRPSLVHRRALLPWPLLRAPQPASLPLRVGLGLVAWMCFLEWCWCSRPVPFQQPVDAKVKLASLTFAKERNATHQSLRTLKSVLNQQMRTLQSALCVNSTAFTLCLAVCCCAYGFVVDSTMQDKGTRLLRLKERNNYVYVWKKPVTW